MTTAVKKYNPGFLSDEQIIDSFCVRTTELESIVESLRENGGNSNPHTIVIGPRGIGKTHLLMRVAAQVRNDESLNGYFPIIFPEESYEVSTCGEFWLECLDHLAHQAPSDERDNLTLTHEDVSSETNDQVLAQRCLGALLDFADRQQKRLLLVVENLNMLFDEIRDPDVGWQLRKTLQTEPRIMLLASATSRFEAMDNYDLALYDLFRTITLRPLNTEECAALWRSVSGSEVETASVRPIEIFSGGNPRLVTIIATFGADRPFQELMENLLGLVDDHTEYFKSHLEHLPPQERRVYLALARLWKPATTQEVATLARVDTNQCSALLRRLTDRGAVSIEGGTPRRRQFYLTERLYNIYYLLRRGSGTQQAVENLIEFMIAWYSPQELLGILEQTYLKSHSTKIPPPDIYVPFAKAGIDGALKQWRQGDLEGAYYVCDRLSQAPDLSNSYGSRSVKMMSVSMKSDLQIELGRFDEAIAVSDYIIDSCESARNDLTNDDRVFFHASALDSKGRALLATANYADAIETLDRALETYNLLKDSAFTEVIQFGIDDVLLAKSVAHWACKEHSTALSALNLIIRNYLEEADSLAEEEARSVVGKAITVKSIVLSDVGTTITDDEFEIWFQHVARFGFDQSEIMALTSYVVLSGPVVALDLILKCPVTDVFAPVVVALQQELGQTPRVAREVEEVARDVRQSFANEAERRGIEWPHNNVAEASS